MCSTQLSATSEDKKNIASIIYKFTNTTTKWCLIKLITIQKIILTKTPHEKRSIIDGVLNTPQHDKKFWSSFLTITNTQQKCSEKTIETLEKVVKYVQS